MTPMAHLTCVGPQPHASSRTSSSRYRDSGIENILALGGDPPPDVDLPEGELKHAIELVQLVRGIGDFSVGVAAHPEPHPRSPSREADRLHTAEKLAAADFAITQFFFDAEHYFDLVAALHAHGVDKPVIPGIMPATTLGSIKRMSQLQGSEFPRWLADKLEAVGDDPEAVFAVGVEEATKLARTLIDGGAPGLHFYTLNRSTATRQIYENLGLVSPLGLGSRCACGRARPATRSATRSGAERNGEWLVGHSTVVRAPSCHRSLELRMDCRIVGADHVRRRTLAPGDRSRDVSEGHSGLRAEPFHCPGRRLCVAVLEQARGCAVGSERDRPVVVPHERLDQVGPAFVREVELGRLLDRGGHARLAFVERERSEVHEVTHRRMHACLGDHCAAVRVAEQHARTLDRVEHLAHPSGVGVQVTERTWICAVTGKVDRDRRDPCVGQSVEHPLEAPRPMPGPMDEHHRRSHRARFPPHSFSRHFRTYVG